MSDDRRGSIERQIFLRSMNMARNIGDSGASAHLAQLMRDVAFQAGQTLFRAGAVADEVFFVVRGEVHMVAPHQEPWKFGERSVIGVIDMLNDRPHHRTAIAMTDVHALALKGEDWIELLEDNFELTRTIIGNVSAGMVELARDLPTFGFHPPEGGATTDARKRLPMGPLDLVGKLLVLRDAPAFFMARLQALTSLAEVAHEEHLDAGGRLFAAGDEPKALHVVARGAVEIVSDRLVRPVRFGSGSVVPGHAAFSSAPWPWTVRAVEPATLLRIKREDFLDIMEVHHEIPRSILAYMALERGPIMTERADAEALAAEAASARAQPTAPAPVGG